MVALADHMWQTLQVFVCLAAFAFLTRHNSARFRIWLWRLAALKLVIPLQLLYLIGGWVSFPVSHSSDPPPPALLRLVNELAPWFAPTGELGTGMRWIFLAALALGTAAVAWCIRSRLRAEAPRVTVELQRLEKDPDDRPRGVGFFNSALMTAWSLLLLSGSVLSGALDDRVRRQQLLHRNELGLKNATVEMKPAARGMGSRHRVVADERGVTIRNATLQEIGGLAYGVGVYLVRGQHFAKVGEVDWLTGSRYDVHVSGEVIEPDDFDTYALREPLTKALATQFGLEIYQNGKCEPPCGRWGSYVLPASALAAIEAASAPVDSTPAALAEPPRTRERFDAYLQAFNSGDRQTLDDFHREFLNAHSHTSMSVDEELILQKQTGGFDVLEFKEVRPRVASGWLRGRDSDALMAFDFQMEPVEPFRISHRSIGWGTPPEQYFPKRLTEAAALKALRAELEQRAKSGKLSGAVLVARGGEVLLRQAHGLADRENQLPNKIDTRFRIASVTKMFTAVAVLRLVQEGRISLDDTIDKWVPEVAGKPVAPATIHQLLTHTSGAGDIFGPEHIQQHLKLRTHADYIRLFADQPLRFPPGTRYQYSNLGYLLLGRMIERVSGMSYHRFVREQVFAPAGMTRSGTEPEQAQVEGRSRIYEKPLGMHQYVPAMYVLDYRATAAGHAYSSIDDLAQFVGALRSHRLLDEKHTQLMLKPHQEIWKGASYGYGTMIKSYEWTGNWTGHTGGYTGMDAQLWFSPDTNYLVVVLSNIDPPAAMQVSDFITARLPLEK